MTNQALGDVINADPYSVAELRKMVFEGQGELSRPLALSLLERKSYPQKVKDLERLLRDDHQPPRLRSMAAVALGTIGTPPAVAALQRGATTKEPLALRGIVKGLSVAGGEDARSFIEGLKRRGGGVGDAARAEAGLLSHRAGARGSEITAPEGGPRVDPRKATPIEIAPARREDAEEALTHVTKAVPALRLTTAGALSLQCEDRRFMFLLSEATKKGLGQFAEAKAEAGVVATQRTTEGVGWEVKYHVLTRPRSGGSIDLTVVTHRGRLVLAGSARIVGERAEFELRAVDGSGALPISLNGTYDGQTLDIRDARSNLRRRPSPAPALLRSE